MIYLDHTATTPVRKEVLDTFVKVSQDFIGNPNSLHALGLQSKKLMIEATKQVADLLKVKEDEVIFTSNSSESNNLAIKGMFNFYTKRKRMVVTTKLEHSSVLETVKSLKNVEIVYVDLDEFGHINIKHLEQLLQEEPLLVTIQHVNSEVGIIQDIEQIGKLIKKYPKTFFHVDGTQSVGKIPINLENVDLFTFSAQKIYGLKGIAALIKKEKIELAPLISGGASQSKYRAGTPSVALIASFAKALRYAMTEQETSYSYVLSLNQFLRSELKKIPTIIINSTEQDSPFIFNFSIPGEKPETMIHRLEQHEIYVSTNTACSSKKNYSSTLLSLHKSEEIAASSLRIGLSKSNTKEELIEFIKIIRKEIL